MGLEYYQIDAFASQPFAGNPAAVFLLDTQRPDDWMLNVAIEMNLSETAFLLPIDQDNYHLRWFTPAFEVDLCGHATLAAAHFLSETNRWTGQSPLRFQTRSGELTVQAKTPGYQMTFPIDHPTQVSDEIKQQALTALNLTDAVQIIKGRDDLLVEVAHFDQLHALKPDFNAVAELPFRGVIVTSAADADTTPKPKYDFISRFFAPAAGVNEDPVTGSAHCLLAPFWKNQLNKNEMTGFQASKRTGVVGIICETETVKLTGEAVTTCIGKLFTP